MKKSIWTVILTGALSLALSGCGGSNGGASTGGTGGGSGGSGGSQANLSISVTGLTSGASVTVQATDVVDNQQVAQQSVTASSNGTVAFAQSFETNSAAGGNARVTFAITAQPSNGEQCVLTASGSDSSQSNGSWTFSPNPVGVTCSSPVKPAAYPQIGTFPGVSSVKVIASPKVVPVFLSGSANENTDLTFVQQLVVSQYWSALTEYGVGSGTVESALYPTAPASLSSGSVSDSQIRSAIESNSAWGAPVDASTVIAVFLPAGVTYAPTTSQGEPYDARGDHGQVTVNGVNVQFIAIFTTTGGTEVQQTAQYLIDAVTNPGGGGADMGASAGYVEMAPDAEAYAGIFYHNPQSSYQDVNHNGQEFVELGNACDGVASPESDLTLANGVYLFAIWSNQTASSDYQQGNYGYCQPAFGESVDYSSNSDTQSVTATRFGHTFSDQALVVAAGSSTTVTVTAWGQDVVSGTAQPWPLTVAPEIYYVSGTAAPADCSTGTPNYEAFLVPTACANAPTVKVSPSGSSSVTNGDTFTVTITMPATGEPGLWSILLSGTDGGTEMPILVTNNATWQ